MDPSSKKRKSDENGTAAESPSASLTPEDARKVIEAFNQEQLIDIVAEAMCRDEGVLSSVRQIADRDPVQRRLFIRGLGWETTTEKIRSLFSKYGDLEEAVVILDKTTGKSKGYGFITFRHIDGALLALKDPSKKIDGRMTVTQLAAAGPAGPTAAAPPPVDVSQRKIFVGNVPANMSSDRLLALFGSYGEIEEGPLGFDKQTGKFRGYALFVYKTVEAAQAALDDPVKIIDGNTLQCKLAIDGKKGRPVAGVAGAGIPGQPVGGTGADGLGGGLGTGSQSSFHGSLSTQFGAPGGSLSSYGGFSNSGGHPMVAGLGYQHHLNSAMQSSIGLGNASMPSLGSQVPSLGSQVPSLGSQVPSLGSQVPSLGSQVSSLTSQGSSLGSLAPSSLGGSGVGAYPGGGLSGGPYGSSSLYPGSGGYGGLGMGSSLYHTPIGSAGMPSSGYPEGGQSSSSLYQAQNPQATGSSPRARIPPGGGMYQSFPHYF